MGSGILAQTRIVASSYLSIKSTILLPIKNWSTIM